MEDESDILHANLSKSLQHAVMDILTYTSSEAGRGLVPLISSAEGISPFPVQLRARIEGQEF